MAERDSIGAILDSYELNPGERRSIEGIVRTQFKHYGVAQFREQYYYIAELIEHCRTPHPERTALRFNHPVSFDNDRPLEEYIGREDPSLQQIIEGKNQVRTVHALEIIELLEEHLEAHQLGFIRALLCRHGEDKLWRVSTQRVRENIPSIQKRLNYLLSRYWRNEDIALPERPIKEVITHPDGTLDIKYGLRSFGSNPLEHFRRHHDAYGGLSRSELAKFDQGLYQALRSAGQLEEAIPEMRYMPGKHLSTAQIAEVESVYAQTGNIHKTARLTGRSASTVTKYVKLMKETAA